MKYSIVALLDSFKRDVNAYVNEAFSDSTNRADEIDRWIPFKEYADLELLAVKYESFPTIGRLIASDGEVPNERTRTKLKAELLKQCKIGKSELYTSTDFDRIKRMNEMLAAGGASATTAREIRNSFLVRPAGQVPRLFDTARLMQIEIHSTGILQYKDPVTELELQIDFSGDVTTDNFPAALTGAARWNQHATANAVFDLIAHLRAYKSNAARRLPAAIVMRPELLWDVQKQDAVRIAAAALRGLQVDSSDTAAVAALPDASKVEIESLIERSLGKRVPIATHDSTYNDVDADGNDLEDQYFLPDDRYFFVTPKNAENALLATAENNYRPGVFTLTEVVDKLPRKERSAAMMGYVPFVRKPRYLGGRTVK